MTVSTYSIPETPRAELLAELDAATDALDALTARAAELTLAMDEESRRLRIELRSGGELQALTPTQLFELLG
jgi:hypothetical protein